MHMGRPRERNKDLPPGLQRKPDGVYYWQPTRGLRGITTIGKVDRDAAIREWTKLSNKVPEKGEGGTVAELIEAYTQREIPRRLKANKMSQVTADEYNRQAPKLRELFGHYLYALTQAQCMRDDVLRTVHVQNYVDEHDGQRGSVYANRMAVLLSTIFKSAIRRGLCAFNPCVGVEKNTEVARKNWLGDDDRTKVSEGLNGAPRLIALMSNVTSIRKTDIRNLLQSHVGPELIKITPSKTRRSTGIKQEWEITPAIREILDAAAKLPGRARSLYVFPTRRGTPYTESALQNAWRRMQKRTGIVGATFRDFRTSELNSVHSEGGDATKQAGHADARTTQKHYIVAPVRVRARK